MNSKIIVSNLIEDSFSPIAGHKLGKKLSESLQNGDVQLDFSGVSPFTSLFFNAMFSELKGLGDLKNLVNNILITGLEGDDYETYERCMKNAIEKQ